MDESLPPKARVPEARHAAKALLRTAGVTSSPVLISKVLPHVQSAFNLTVQGTRDLPVGIDALLYREDGYILLGYSENVAPVRQKFSVAHELGHLYMGHVHGRSRIDLDSENFDEIEANQFAAQLVMPTQFLRADIRSGIKDVDTLAKRYVVSSEAMWWQLSKTGLIRQL